MIVCGDFVVPAEAGTRSGEALVPPGPRFRGGDILSLRGKG
jgi:hypothetical protein